MFLTAKAATQKCAGKYGDHRAEDFHRIPSPVYGISSCNACGPAFYRAYGRDENVFLLTVPALVQNVINNGVLSGAVYGNFKVNARLFLADMDGLFFPVDVAEPQCPDVTASEAGMQRQQENRLIPLVDKAVRLIFQKVCLYFSSIVVMILFLDWRILGRA